MPFEANSTGPRERHISAEQLAAGAGLCSLLSARLTLTAAPGRPGRGEPTLRRGRDGLADAGNKNREGINGQGRTELREVQGCKAERSRSQFHLGRWLHTAVNERSLGCIAC